MKSVSNIFGGEAKVKIMRLFIFNPNSTFTTSEVSTRAKENTDKARREIGGLVKAGFVKRRSRGYILDAAYPYLTAIENFLIDATPVTSKELVKRISTSGNIKLILISGVFLHDRDARVDILIVGDHIRQARLSSVVASIEAELGKELRYAAFETTDFKYRLSIYDKLIRDILDYRHEKILNKLAL